MKHTICVSFFIGAFFFLQILALAQSKTDTLNVLSIKNGSTVKGDVSKTIADSTKSIKTTNRDTLQIIKADTQHPHGDSLSKGNSQEKLKKNKYGQVFPTNVHDNSDEINNSSMSLSLGLGIPTSKFTESGYISAKTGVAVSFTWASRGYIGVMCNVTYAHNGAAIENYDGSVSSGWNTFWLLGGMKFGSKSPDGDNYYVGPLIGLCSISYPELTSTERLSGSGSTATYFTVKSKEESASALAIGAILSGNIGHVQLGIMYALAFRKHYTTSITSYSNYMYTESWSSEYRADITVCELSIGYHF